MGPKRCLSYGARQLHASESVGIYTSGLAGGLVYGDRFAQRPTCERRGARLRNIRGVFRCVLGTDPCPKRAKLSLSVNSWGILIVLGVDLPVALIAFFASTWKRF